MTCPFCGQRNFVDRIPGTEEESKVEDLFLARKTKSIPMFINIADRFVRKVLRVEKIIIFVLLLIMVFTLVVTPAFGAAVRFFKKSSVLSEVSKLYEQEQFTLLVDRMRSGGYMGKEGFEQYTEMVLLYEKYLDLDKLGDFIRETFQEHYHTSIEEDMRQEGQLSYAFLLAVLVALNGGDPSRVYGKVACFCRFLKKTFGGLVRTLRSFQYYINKFIKFLRERKNGETARTMIVNDVERVVIRNKKFFSGEQLVSQVSGVLTKKAIISYC
jgi:hypothetical protein